MNSSHDKNHDFFEETVEKKVRRKIKGREEKDSYSAWFGLGMFGLIGWSVAVPAVLLTLLGVWLDAHTGGSVSWTLTFLFIGITIGCLNAWRWIEKKRNE